MNRIETFLARLGQLVDPVAADTGMDPNAAAVRAGRRRFGRAIGVSESLISTAIANDEFPGRWFDNVCTLAAALGLDQPDRSLFSWRPLPDDADMPAPRDEPEPVE